MTTTMGRVPVMRRVCVSMIGLGSLLAMVVVGAPVALGVPTLTVDPFEDTFDGSCGDGDCSLRDAIVAVDPAGGRGVDICRGGEGRDVTRRCETVS
jgi:CSLREA domain-containing protein